MNEVTAGLVAIGVGLVVGFAGYRALRVVIALLGAVAGFGVGAAAADAFTTGGTLATAVTWLGAVVGAVVFGWLAYAFYRLAVLLGLAVIGFSIGSGVTAGLGFGTGWLTWLVGAVVAVILVAIGLAGDLPAVLLILLTGLVGAHLAITGVMLVTGAMDLAQVSVTAADPVAVGWGWAAGSVVLAALCIAYQWRSLRRSGGVVRRTQWAGAGAR